MSPFTAGLVLFYMVLIAPVLAWLKLPVILAVPFGFIFGIVARLYIILVSANPTDENKE